MKETKEIKSIKTPYDGYLFQSRLEARWAVFFKSCGIEYEYEPEGYEINIDGVRYCPDFYLPDLDIHCEVKGKRSGYEDELLRAKKFITWGGPIKILMILSDIPNPPKIGLPHFPAFYWDGRKMKVKSGWSYFFNDDSETVKATLSLEDYSLPSDISSVTDWELKKHSIFNEEQEKAIQEVMRGLNHSVYEGLKKARCARWGHGEQGDQHAND